MDDKTKAVAVVARPAEDSRLHRVRVLGDIHFCNERAHGVAEQERRLARVLLLGDSAETVHIVDDGLVGPLRQLSDVRNGCGGLSVAEMVLSVADETAVGETRGQTVKAVDVFADTVGNQVDSDGLHVRVVPDQIADFCRAARRVKKTFFSFGCHRQYSLKK